MTQKIGNFIYRGTGFLLKGTLSIHSLLAKRVLRPMKNLLMFALLQQFLEPYSVPTVD